MVSVQRPHGVDVSVFNPNEIVYVKGNETTDDSIRLIPDPITTGHAELQLRASGVWNSTGLSLSGQSLLLGRELIISCFGEFIQGFDDFEEKLQLHPHIHYNDAGTSDAGYMPKLGARTATIVQSDSSSEITGSVLTFQTIPLAESRITDEIDIKVGTVAPTGNVLVEGWRDAIDGDFPVLRTTYPAAFLDQPDGTQIGIPLANATQFGAFGTYVRLTVSDGSDMSLRSDSSGNPWMQISSWGLEDDQVLTASLIGRFLTTLTSDTIADNNGDLVTAGMSV